MISFLFFLNCWCVFITFPYPNILQPIRSTVCWSSQLHCVASHWVPKGTKPPIQGQSGPSTLEWDTLISIFSCRKNCAAPPTYLNPSHPRTTSGFSFTQVCFWLARRQPMVNRPGPAQPCVRDPKRHSIDGLFCPILPPVTSVKVTPPPFSGSAGPKRELRLKSS